MFHFLNMAERVALVAIAGHFLVGGKDGKSAFCHHRGKIPAISYKKRAW